MPTTLFWDASSYVKRFTGEPGAETVQALIDFLPQPDMIVTTWGYAEIYSILIRAFNGGRIAQTSLLRSLALLKADVLDAPGFEVLTIPDVTIFASLQLVHRHNLNSSDAAILATYLLVQQSVTPTGTQCLLVSADNRLNRAADAEGLPFVNPETTVADGIPALLSPL